MDAAERNEEEKAGKVGVVSVTDTRVDPRAVVVHLHYASAWGQNGRIINEENR